MTTVAQSAAIEREITGWISKPMGSRGRRAEVVLRWCADNSMHVGVTPVQLAAAMGRMPFWQQGPRDYLDMAMAIDAALKA